LWDAEGRRYLDFVQGWAVNTLGHSPDVLAAALARQAATLVTASPAYHNENELALAARLAELSRLPRVFFGNSGAEANEGAIKLARKWGKVHRGGAYEVVTTENSFHGRTLATMAASGKPGFDRIFLPPIDGFVKVPFGDASAVERAIGAKTAAILVEPIQGEAGVVVPPDGYLRDLRAVADRHGVLLMLDEIQTGVGRTGKFLAIEHFGVEPDIVVLAKALSGGHAPIGVTLTREWIFNKVFDRMDRSVVHGSTFSKNDMAMAAALATLEVLEDENVIENAAAKGDRLLASLSKMAERYELVSAVRGKGMMIGVEFGPPKSLMLKATWNLLEAASSGLFGQLICIPLFKDHKILTQVAGHGNPTIKLLPSLTLTDEDCAWIERSFDQVIAEAHRAPSAVLSLGKTLAEHAIKARVSG